MKIEYECVTCGLRLADDSPLYTCPRCSAAVDTSGFRRGNLVVVQPEKVSGGSGGRVNVSAALPFDPLQLSSFPAGGTPLSRPARLCRRYGFDKLLFKNDHLNPSGSLKDRASLLVALQAIELGEKTVAVASTGNAGSAMSCAGAAAGLTTVLFVPDSAPRAKLLQSMLYGALVVPVAGTYDDTFSLSIEYTKIAGGINRNTAYNPLTLEGKKTVALEIYNQLGCRVPDTVYISAGDGVIFSGVFKGFADLKKAGFIQSLPKLILVQAEGSNAISRSYRTGTETVLSAAKTIADSISVASPASGELALRALSETGGYSVEVSDQDIKTAQKELCEQSGVFVEPAAAAAWAGCIADIHSIDAESETVVLLTGTGFKDFDTANSLVNLPPSCPADIDSIMRFLSDYYKSQR